MKATTEKDDLMDLRRVFYGVSEGRVVTLVADIGEPIADDVADMIRDGQTVYSVPLAEAPALGDHHD